MIMMGLQKKSMPSGTGRKCFLPTIKIYGIINSPGPNYTG